jgi:hypothetical protein
MPQSILMITAIVGAENCAAVLSKQFGLNVETARSRKEGLAALRRREFAVIVADQSLVEGDGDMDALLKHAGLAIPLEINFAISGCGRVVREVRAALLRRDREKDLALSAAASSIRSELRDGLAGLLLQSQLALAEPGIPPQLSERLELLLELAATLRQRLDEPQPQVKAPAIRQHLPHARPAIHAATVA